MRFAALLFCLFLVPVVATAAIAPLKFKNDAEEHRYYELIEELRCLVCQNQSLADSNAGLAGDLRKEVYDLMQSGKSDEKIVEYLVARYGDFVLYRPPIKPATYALWIGPFVLFVLALLGLFRFIAKSGKTKSAQLSEQDQQKIDHLLSESEKQGS